VAYLKTYCIACNRYIGALRWQDRKFRRPQNKTVPVDRLSADSENGAFAAGAGQPEIERAKRKRQSPDLRGLAGLSIPAAGYGLPAPIAVKVAL
jgi:hypothetical protein